MVEKKWILGNRFSSPWKVALLPMFLDFSRKDGIAITASLGGQGNSSSPYFLDDNQLKIGANFLLKIISLDSSKLTVENNGLEFSYYSVPELLNIDREKFLHNLIDKKWVQNENNLFFTDNVEIGLGGISGRKMIQYVDQKKFFGIYYLDTIDNKLVCVFLIDGKFPMMFFVKEFNEKKIILLEPNSAEIEIHLK